MRRAALIVGLLFASQSAFAGSLLDFMRNYDLNDYALGIGISAEQNPYLGAKSSTYAYPYLTSFRHSSLTDDWILIRDGEFGFRWVSDGGWELGAIGRIQTRGLGKLESDELLGISDRNWAIELGPTIGWRGWPIHINWTTYVEPTKRHEGLISQLTFLLPIELSRGYFVPSVEVIHQSNDYADYYYSVTAAEVTPTRPAYQAGANISTAIRLRWGYALSEKWLLAAKLGLEKLGSEITASPIVDKKHIWSAGISLAYNANVFQPRKYAGPPPRAAKFDLRISGFLDTISTKVARDTTDGIPGFETDIEDFLGVSDQETVLQIDATVRIGHYHRLEFGYFELGRDSTTTFSSNLNFGNEVFSTGTEVTTAIKAKILRAGYAYSLIRNAQLEVGVMAGLHLISLKTDIAADATNQSERSNARTPLPVFGAHASVVLAERTSLSAKLQFFRTDFDRFEGSLIFASLDIQRRMAARISVGFGYHFYGMKLTSDDREVNGYLKVRHHGPVAFFTLGF